MSTIKTLPRPDGSVPRRAHAERHCKTCGKKVTRYKNPKAIVVLCYCCEDKLPWTYALIAGGGVHGECTGRIVGKNGLES